MKFLNDWLKSKFSWISRDTKNDPIAVRVVDLRTLLQRFYTIFFSTRNLFLHHSRFWCLREILLREIWLRARASLAMHCFTFKKWSKPASLRRIFECYRILENLITWQNVNAVPEKGLADQARTRSSSLYWLSSRGGKILIYIKKWRINKKNHSFFFRNL